MCRFRHYEGWHQRWYEEHEHGQMSQLLNAGPLSLHDLWADPLLEDGITTAVPVRAAPGCSHTRIYSRVQGPCSAEGRDTCTDCEACG